MEDYEHWSHVCTHQHHCRRRQLIPNTPCPLLEQLEHWLALQPTLTDGFDGGRIRCLLKNATERLQIRHWYILPSPNTLLYSEEGRLRS